MARYDGCGMGALAHDRYDMRGLAYSCDMETLPYVKVVPSSSWLQQVCI